MGALVVILLSTAFFGVDALCYWIAIELQDRPLWNNWPGSGYVELWRAMRKRRR